MDANDAESDLQMKVGDANAAYEGAKAELNAIEEHAMNFSSDLSILKSIKSNLMKKAEYLELEAKKLHVQISKIAKKERTNAEKFVTAMMKKHTWIKSDRVAFGAEGGEYDFKSTNPDEMSAECSALKNEQDALEKINNKVMGMIEKWEGEYTELLRKRKVVENDKKKIQAVIEVLDFKKKYELERTWKKVNGDFGSIFTTLLPGASVKLEPPEGMAAWEGSEFKVVFGDAWKKSLSDLSGGQQSLLLLALILIMYLPLFKPAPMYILDEVDAALDLSHTKISGTC